MSPENESKSNAPPKALVNDEEEGVANATGKDEQPVVAKVPCVEVAEAIVSIQNGDADQGLVMIPLGNDEFWTPSMSAAHYQVHEDSFGMEQIFLSGDPYDVSYSVSCETSMAACETHPGLLCDVLPSAATASSAQALSYEDAFGGAIHFLGPRGRGLRAKGAI